MLGRPFTAGLLDHFRQLGQNGPPLRRRQSVHDRAQRVFQFSTALTRPDDPTAPRLVPINFVHAPTPAKPRKTAAPQAWEQYRKACQQANLCRQAAAQWKNLEQALQPRQDSPQMRCSTQRLLQQLRAEVWGGRGLGL